jgi:hypothetical protein
MNMISTGSFLTEMDASNKQGTLAEKFAAVWEKKNNKAARAGGVSLMALSLAACGSDDDTSGNDTTETGSVTSIASDLTNASDNYVGTSGDDVVTAGAVYTPGGNDRINSLQDEDVLDGGAGDDTINITVTTANDNGNVIITPTMSAIENVNVVFASSADDSELDFQDVTGVVDLALTRISTDGNVTVDNIQDVISTLTLSNSGEDTDSITISFDDNVLEGAADALAMSVNGVDVAFVEVDGEDGEGYETINMAATGDMIADDFEVDGTETLNITGAGDVTLGGFSVSAGHLATIDASGSTGDMDIELGDDNVVEARVSGSSGADIDFTYTGSAGDDYIRVDDESLSAAPTAGDDDNGHDTIDGGAGDNTLDFTVDTTRDLIHNDVTVSNIQDVHIDITAAVTADLDGQQFGEATGSADVDTITVRNNLASGTAGVADFDLNDLDAGVLVRVQHATDDTNSTTAANTNVYVHQMDGTGTADTQTVEIISGTNTAEAFNFTLNVQANDADAADVNDAEVESVTIIDSDSENNTVVLSSVAEHDGTVTLTGGRADDEFTVSGAIIAETVDASGQLSDTTITVGTADQDITMGSGDDTIIFEATDDLDENDVDIDGGAGTDTVLAVFDADPADDLEIDNVETLKMAFVTDTGADNSVTIDITNSDDVVNVELMGDGGTYDGVGALTVVAADVITLEADAVSSIAFLAEDDTDAIFNGLTISPFETGTPATVTMAVNWQEGDGTADAEANDDATIGVVTLDADVTTLTVSTNNNEDAAVTTYNGILAAGLTTLTITDGYTAANDTNYEQVINLDDTVALTSINATGALGGVNMNVEALADNATIDLRNTDDVEADADDALTITFLGDTGADDLTITGGAGVETITITNGDLDDLTINVGAGNDVVTLTGAQGDNIEINAGTGNDVIVGSNDDDEIVAGAGTDNITGGAGADQIDLVETTSAADNVIYVEATDGGTAGVDGGHDVITGFVSTSDDIMIDGALETAILDGGDATLNITTITHGGGATALDHEATANQDEAIFIAGSSLTAAQLSDVSAVAAYLETEITLTAQAGDDAIIVIESTTAGTFGVYSYLEAGTDDQYDAGDISILATVVADDVVAGDLALA